MSQPLQFEGRVWIRLSDVPMDKRLEVAAQLCDQVLDDVGGDTALIESAFLRRVAEDPEAAAVEIPGQCVNRRFCVSRAEYDVIVLGRPRRRVSRKQREAMRAAVS